jgi:hypothetical protein
MTQDNNTPAFPIKGGVHEYQFSGMTLRDYFAGQALTGILANNGTPWAPDIADVSDNDIAKASYDLADEMLLARSAPSPSEGGKDG